jgi:hypothetical protein
MHSDPLNSEDRGSGLTSIFLPTTIGALLGAGYGLLVLITHLLTTGRWERAFTFAIGSTAVSAALGLAGGIIYAGIRAWHRHAGRHSPAHGAGTR